MFALFSSRSIRLEQLGVELEEYALFTIPVIEFASRLPSAASHSFGFSVVAEQVFDGTRNRLRVVWIDQYTAPRFTYDLPPQGKVRSDHRDTRSHVLEQLDGHCIHEIWLRLKHQKAQAHAGEQVCN
jgi:hypothetical protein